MSEVECHKLGVTSHVSQVACHELNVTLCFSYVEDKLDMMDVFFANLCQFRDVINSQGTKYTSL